MEEYEERLINEYEELSEKIIKLKKFIENYDDFASEHEVVEPKNVFIDQYEAMCDYKDALILRLYLHGIAC